MSQTTVMFNQQHCENLKTHKSLLKRQYYLHVNSQTSMAPDSVHTEETSHFMIITKNSNMTKHSRGQTRILQRTSQLPRVQGSKIKRGPIHKLKTIKRAMKSDWPDHRHNTKRKPEHMYLKFWTPLTPSVEKIANLCGFKFINH